MDFACIGSDLETDRSQQGFPSHQPLAGQEGQSVETVSMKEAISLDFATEAWRIGTATATPKRTIPAVWFSVHCTLNAEYGKNLRAYGIFLESSIL